MQVDGKVVVITGAAGGIGAALARRFAAEGAAGSRAVRCRRRGGARAGVRHRPGDPGSGATSPTARRSPAWSTARRGGVRPGRPVLLQRRHHHRRRPRHDRGRLAAGLGGQRASRTSTRPGPCCRRMLDARRRLPAADLLGGRAADRGRRRAVRGDQARGGGVRRVAVDHVRRTGASRSARCARRACGTPMLDDGARAAGHVGALVTAASGAVLTPEEVADAVVDGLAAERFLILPHPEVATYRRNKARDPDRLARRDARDRRAGRGRVVTAWFGSKRCLVGWRCCAQVPGGRPGGEQGEGVRGG